MLSFFITFFRDLLFLKMTWIFASPGFLYNLGLLLVVIAKVDFIREKDNFLVLRTRSFVPFLVCKGCFFVYKVFGDKIYYMGLPFVQVSCLDMSLKGVDGRFVVEISCRRKVFVF